MDNKKERRVKFSYEVKREVFFESLGITLSSNDLDLIKSDATDYLVNGEAMDPTQAWVMAVAQAINRLDARDSSDNPYTRS